jgi:hypothetical protein
VTGPRAISLCASTLLVSLGSLPARWSLVCVEYLRTGPTSMNCDHLELDVRSIRSAALGSRRAVLSRRGRGLRFNICDAVSHGEFGHTPSSASMQPAN